MDNTDISAIGSRETSHPGCVLLVALLGSVHGRPDTAGFSGRPLLVIYESLWLDPSLQPVLLPAFATLAWDVCVCHFSGRRQPGALRFWITDLGPSGID